MSHDYWYCPICKGNFDHGEPCDCGNELPRVFTPDDYGVKPDPVEMKLSGILQDEEKRIRGM